MSETINLYSPRIGLSLMNVPAGSVICETCYGRGFNFEGDTDPPGLPLKRWRIAKLYKVDCSDCKGEGYV